MLLRSNNSVVIENEKLISIVSKKKVVVRYEYLELLILLFIFFDMK